MSEKTKSKERRAKDQIPNPAHFIPPNNFNNTLQAYVLTLYMYNCTVYSIVYNISAEGWALMKINKFFFCWRKLKHKAETQLKNTYEVGSEKKSK